MINSQSKDNDYLEGVEKRKKKQEQKKRKKEKVIFYHNSFGLSN
jgi:hypothetical protein